MPAGGGPPGSRAGGPGDAAVPAGRAAGLRDLRAAAGISLVQRQTRLPVPPRLHQRHWLQPGPPKNLYVREDQILPRLAALAILHADGGHSPQGGEQASAPVTASAQAADLIDRLQAADVTLIYDPATRALPARTGSPAWKTSPIWPPPKASSPRQRSRQRVNDLQALARRGQGQCRSRWRRAGPRAVPRCRAAAGVDHPVGGRQLRDIGDRTHPRAVPRGHSQRGDDLVSPPGNSRSGPLRVCPARRGSPSFRPHDHHRTAVRIATRMAIPGKDARPTQRAASGPA